MNYLLDTCVISELAKREPNAGVVHWLQSHDEKSFYLSVVSIGEVQKGLATLDDGARHARLADWLEQLIERFGPRVLAIDAEVMRAWGTLVGRRQRTGVNLPTLHALLAATASVYGLDIVSRNVNDFKRCEIIAVNPWTA